MNGNTTRTIAFYYCAAAVFRHIKIIRKGRKLYYGYFFIRFWKLHRLTRLRQNRRCHFSVADSAVVLSAESSESVLFAAVTLDKVAAAYISGDYDEYQKLLEEAQQKKPAPIAESELSELQKQAIQFVLSLSDDQLRQFIRIGKALINEK